MHQQRMAVDLANSGSDLVREVLADSWVTDAELSAARDDFRECLAGWDGEDEIELAFQDDGGYSVGPVPGSTEESERLDAFTDDCSAAYGTIRIYHHEFRANPQGQTYVEAVRSCFEAEGVPDGAGLSAAAFEELIFGEDGDQMYEPESDAGKECVRQPFRGGY